MAFTSSVLANNRVSTLNSNNSISSIKEMTINENNSYLYSVLEFNEKMHTLEIKDRISYYRSLVESINNPSRIEQIHESLVIDGIKRIVELISHIIELAKEKISTIFTMNSMLQSEFNMKKNSSKGFIKNIDMEKEYTFTCFNYPMFSSLDSRICDEALREIFDNINDICSGRDLPEVSDTTLKISYSRLARGIEDECRRAAMSEVKRNYTGSCEDREEFTKFIRNNIAFSYRDRMPYYRWKDNFIDSITDVSKNTINDKMKYIINKLDDIKERVSNMETLDDLQRKNLNAYISQANSIIRSYEWFLHYVMNMRCAHMKEVIRVYNNIINNVEATSESGIIHGEIFDSDTLFDNEDIRDFNRTEWTDLKLEAEIYQARYNIAEEYKNAAIHEALIRTNESTNHEKYIQLEALNNQTRQNIKIIIDEFIRNIIKFFDQAISTVIDKINPQALYVKVNNKTILGNRFKIQAKSKIDLFNGINRVREDILRPVSYDYEELKEDLENVDIFFKKRILPDLERSRIRLRNNVSYNDQMGINEYMRQYYGLPFGNNANEIVFSADVLEQNKQAMLRYIGSANSEIFSKIRSNLSQLEIDAKRAAANMSKPASAPKSIPEKTGENNSESNDDSSKNEAVYSFLYDTWFTEADIEVVDKDGNVVQTAKNGTFATEQTAIQNYLNAYKLVYTARINAARSIISEFYNIMKDHVQSYSGKNVQQSQNSNAQPQQPSTNQATNNAQANNK